MCAANKESLHVSYIHLSQADIRLAMWVGFSSFSLSLCVCVCVCVCVQYLLLQYAGDCV